MSQYGLVSTDFYVFHRSSQNKTNSRRFEYSIVGMYCYDKKSKPISYRHQRIASLGVISWS